MRFVTIKTIEQQARLMQHRTRDQLMRQRTQLINALRSHMAELGIVAAQGQEGLKELPAIMAVRIEGANHQWRRIPPGAQVAAGSPARLAATWCYRARI